MRAVPDTTRPGGRKGTGGRAPAGKMDPMSSTVPVDYADRWFWAYDVSLSILLVEALHAAHERSATQDLRRPDDLLERLRGHAVLGANLAFSLDGHGDDERHYLLSLIMEAVERLRTYGTITAAQAARQFVLDGRPVFLRGDTHVDTNVVADLGQAMIDLVERTLPPAPTGTVWFLGVEGGPRTIGVRRSD